MATIREKLQAEINRANETTKKADVTVHNAVGSLIDGYGKGGGDGKWHRPSTWQDLDKIDFSLLPRCYVFTMEIGEYERRNNLNIGYSYDIFQKQNFYSVQVNEDGSLTQLQNVPVLAGSYNCDFSAFEDGIYTFYLPREMGFALDVYGHFITGATLSNFRIYEVYGYGNGGILNPADNSSGYSTMHTEHVKLFDGHITQYFNFGSVNLIRLDIDNINFSNFVGYVSLGNLSKLRELNADFSSFSVAGETMNLNGFFASMRDIETLDLRGIPFDKANKSYLYYDCVSFVNGAKLREFKIDSLPKVRQASYQYLCHITRESLLNIIDALPQLDSGETFSITLGTYNKSRLTTDEIAIATQKGWTIA